MIKRQHFQRKTFALCRAGFRESFLILSIRAQSRHLFKDKLRYYKIEVEILGLGASRCPASDKVV